MQEKNSTLSTVVFQRMKDDIVSGVLAQGTKIVEQNLAQSFNISRGPLREALQQLADINLITRTPRSGSQVVTLSYELMREVYQMREMLEGFATRLAAEHMQQQDIDTLYRLLESHQNLIAANDGKSYIQQEGDMDFHYYIFSKCNNSLLIKYLEDKLYQMIRMCRQRTSNMTSRVGHALNEHYLIVDAINNRDGEFAEILMRRHISGAWQTLEKILQPSHNKEKL